MSLPILCTLSCIFEVLALKRLSRTCMQATHQRMHSLVAAIRVASEQAAWACSCSAVCRPHIIAPDIAERLACDLFNALAAAQHAPGAAQQGCVIATAYVHAFLGLPQLQVRQGTAPHTCTSLTLCGH